MTIVFLKEIILCHVCLSQVLNRGDVPTAGGAESSSSQKSGGVPKLDLAAQEAEAAGPSEAPKGGNICKFFQKGYCRNAAKCKDLHPGVSIRATVRMGAVQRFLSYLR